MIQFDSLQEFSKYLSGYNCDVSLTGGLPKRLELEAPIALRGVTLNGKVSIGQYSYVGRQSEIRSATIGRFCSIARRVSVGLTEHPVGNLTTHPVSFGSAAGFDQDPYIRKILPTRVPKIDYPPTRIGNDVWIGDGAFIRGGVRIGDGAVIGAHAVVVSDVPPYAIVVGVPARVIKYRFSTGVIERLIVTSWWDRDISSLGGKIPDYSDVEGCLAAIEESNPPIRQVKKWAVAFERNYIGLEELAL
ncbi:CatB-related O-acetyltransferase (plasmid) [Rhizobium sp. 32-5/1]|uniref:CatB-related O-acetyltransferase n=1 Tax=Rhizobium sp. 32-5/1 TaxID=3019602 RepID=UPI00240E31DC|nr:CatB-related O-acetyltransferase [Rhizobium sp. 32-5/1]WEZ85812.1 CatB-related O-acetyltransferase [Rhizobium sp. 32-5/1]